MPDVKEISSAIKRIRAANGMMPSADLTYITIIPAINPLSNQHLVCKNYSLHKVELHQRGDRHFEILYQCIQTLQKSGLTVAGFIQKSSLQARSIRDKFRTSLYLVNYPCTAKRRIKYINSLIYNILLTRFCI